MMSRSCTSIRRSASLATRASSRAPVDACFAEDQLPDEWQKRVQVNADYYQC
jgi:hypothetical protein